MPFEVPERIGGASPDSERLAQIRRTFAESAAPVRPLPSNPVIVLLCAGVFVVLAVLFCIPVGFFGLVKMSASDRLAEYTLVFLLALVLAGGAVEQTIPGSRRIMRPHVSVIVAILLLSISASLLFPNFETHSFLDRGIPCLRLGLLCSIPAAGFTALMMRRGFVVNPIPAAVAGGALSGLLGVAVLALHCPIFNAAHIIAWHVGVIALTSVFGALLGWGVIRYR